MTSSVPGATDADVQALHAQAPCRDVLVDAGRLAAVLALGVHDPRRAQPRVGPLLARLADELDVPVALVSGLLPDVEVLAGAHGLHGWLADARAVPVEWSLSADVVRTGRPRVAGDLAADPATAHDPLVDVDGLRAFAGVPLTSAGGEVVGTVSVLDVRPRAFTADDVEVLRAAAAAVLVLLTGLPVQRTPAPPRLRAR